MGAEAVRELRLRVVYDDAVSAPARAFHAAEKARIADTAKEQARADQDYIKAIKTKLRAMNDLANEIDKRARARDKEQARSEAAYVKSVKAMARAEKDLDDQKAKASAKAQREQERSEQAYVKAVRQQLNAQQQLADQHKRASEAAANQTAGVVKMGLALVGLNSGAMIVGALAQHFDQIRQDAFHAAEDVMRMRGALRELQALRDQMGNTGAGVAHISQMQAQTFQKPADIMAMEAGGLGVGELAIGEAPGKAMTRPEFEKAMVAAGKMQAMEGGEAGAYGQVMGQIALQAKGHITPEEAEGRLNRLYEIQKPGGFRTMSQAMGQYSKLNSLVSNEIYTPEQAMGLASAFSVSSPEEAATKTQQFTRAVMAGRIKARGMKVSADVDLEKTDAYFKRLGIGENDDAIERGKKIADDLAKQKAGAGAGKFNAYEYLMLHGFGNQEDQEAIMDLAGLRNTGRLEKIEAAQNAPLDNGAISRQFDERRKSDPFVKRQEIETVGALGRTKVGLQEEPLIQAQRAAFEKLYAQGKIKGTFEEWQANESGLGGFANRTIEDTFFQNYHRQVNQEAGNTLKRERDRLGLAKRGGWFSDEHGAMQQTAMDIQKAGGDVTGGPQDDLLRELNGSIKELTTEVREARKQGIPGIQPVAGAAMMAAVLPLLNPNGREMRP